MRDDLRTNQPAPNTGPGSTQDLHALLIGIDAYSHSDWKSLNGCVTDVQEVEAFLTGWLDVPQERITKLLAPHPGHDAPSIREAEAPTYENMVAAIRRLARDVPPGSPVLIHYSGHGGRIPTIIPDVKGKGGKDECLVPPDGGEPGARYLRDVELGTLLRELTDAGLVVTLSLDSCHSSGALRGRGTAQPRTVGDISAPASTESAVGTPDELAAGWLGLQKLAAGREPDDGAVQQGAARGLSPHSGWMPVGNYAFLAACLAHQEAYEDRFGGERYGGVFTHWLLELLREGGSDLTYRRLYHRLLAKVHGTFSNQTPTIEGDLDRKVLGLDRLPSRSGITVKEVDRKAGRVTLAAGVAQGLAPGARLEIGPASEEGLRPGAPTRTVEVESVDAVTAVARPVDDDGVDAVSDGDLAVVVDPGSDLLRRAVGIVTDGTDGAVRQTLERLDRRIASEASPFLLRAGNDRSPDFLVGLRNGQDTTTLAVLDAGGTPLPGLAPPCREIDGEAPDADERLVGTLDRIAHAENIRRLSNPDPGSPLREALELELHVLPEGWTPNDQPMPEKLPPLPRRLPVGRWLRFRLRNRSAYTVFATVLDVRPDWSVCQLFPDVDRGGQFEQIEPWGELVYPLQTELPPHVPEAEASDTLKIIASTEHLDTRWLQAPRPGVPRDTRSLRGRSPSSPLDQLLAAVGTGNTRFGTHTGGSGFAPWGTLQASVVVFDPQRLPPGGGPGLR